MQYLPIIVIALAFYFLLIRPRSKAQAATRRINLVQGDDVVSNGGIFGVVVKSFEQRVWVEVAPSVEMIFDRRSLTRLDPSVVDAMEDAENQASALASFNGDDADSEISEGTVSETDSSEESFEGRSRDAREPRSPGEGEENPEDDQGTTEQSQS
ncbi:MAG: preprotein translocase subunit YajC [Acidimicrobiales bacterium]